MPVRIFAISIDKSVVESNPTLAPMLNGQAIDWQRYCQETETEGKKVGQYLWDGPNVMTIWDLISTYKPMVDAESHENSFIMSQDEVSSFTGEGIEQTQGFVRNKFVKLQTLANVFDFEHSHLVFFFS